LIDSVKTLLTGSKPVEQVADRYADGMDQLQVEVEHREDAFLIDPGMGRMTYITGDGRVLLDMRTWDGEPLREATDDEAIGALVVGAKKTSIGELLDLIPTRPPDGLQCPMCSGTRWCTFGGSSSCVSFAEGTAGHRERRSPRPKWMAHGPFATRGTATRWQERDRPKTRCFTSSICMTSSWLGARAVS